VPELPDIEAYKVALAARVVDRPLRRVRVASPFLVRTVLPPLAAAEGRPVVAVRRLGKRLVLALGAIGSPPEAGELFLVVHLMIAGRLRWRSAGSAVPAKVGLAAFDFDDGTLLLTEAGSKRRASLHVVDSEEALAQLDAGGLEVATATPSEFAARLKAEAHTLKRALTDPGLFSGIGNAYSDEILHRARMSPFRLTTALSGAEVEGLRRAAIDVLAEWTARLGAEAETSFPEKVTAFRPEMAVHGRYGQPCPVCGGIVQRVVYAENEMNYCPGCQTGGRLMADRALSRLLRADWPRTVEELEALRRR
jgi:formamidopyrimidine-DNA glycosylase